MDGKNEQNKKRKDPRNAIMIILAVIAVLSIALAVWALFFRDAPTPTPAVPTSAPTPTEEPLTDTIALPQFAWLNLKADTTEQTLTFDNPSRNFAYFRVALEMDDETLWESTLLAPGETSAPVVLSKPLTTGEYEDVILRYRCFSDPEGTNALNGAASPITLKVG